MFQIKDEDFEDIARIVKEAGTRPVVTFHMSDGSHPEFYGVTAEELAVITAYLAAARRGYSGENKTS
jgi:hypothetical protein